MSRRPTHRRPRRPARRRPAARALARAAGARVRARSGSAGPASRSACSRFYLTLPPVLIRTVVPSLAARRWPASRSARSRSAAASGASAGAPSWPAWPGSPARRRRPTRARATSSASSSGRRSLAAMLRYATPLTFAALGGVTSERSGVVNIGLEGMMLCGAFFGAWGADVTGSLGRRARSSGMAAGAAARRSSTPCSRSRLRADQIVSGTAINLLALGITGFLFVDVYGEARARRTTCRRSRTSRCRSAGSRSSATRSRSST